MPRPLICMHPSYPSCMCRGQGADLVTSAPKLLFWDRPRLMYLDRKVLTPWEHPPTVGTWLGCAITNHAHESILPEMEHVRCNITNPMRASSQNWDMGRLLRSGITAFRSMAANVPRSWLMKKIYFIEPKIDFDRQILLYEMILFSSYLHNSQ